MHVKYISDISFFLSRSFFNKRPNKLWIEKMRVKKDYTYFPLNGGRYSEFPQRFVSGRLAAFPHGQWYPLISNSTYVARHWVTWVFTLRHDRLKSSLLTSYCFELVQSCHIKCHFIFILVFFHLFLRSRKIVIK